MRRITRKGRPVGSARQLEHYVFGSERHRADKTVADRLRTTEFVPTTRVATNVEPFPRAEELAENLVRTEVRSELGPEMGPEGGPLGGPLGGPEGGPLGGSLGVSGGDSGGDSGGGTEVKNDRGSSSEWRWVEVKPEVYVGRLKPFTTKSAGTYFTPKKIGGKIATKKNGEMVMQKQYTKAMHDVYISLPPWITEVLADAVQLEGGMPTVKRVVEQAALAAAEELEKRTGYKAVGIALHPDSKHAFGIHIQYLSIDNGQLLGRSAGGGVGKRGLRLAGDVNCALHRFNKVTPVPGKWQNVVESRDYDDIAMIDAVDATIKEILPHGDYLKETYVSDWLDRRHKSRGDIQRELDDVKEQKDSLLSENKRLNKRLAELERILSLTNLRTATTKDHIPIVKEEEL
jgi:hypothetical protein